MSMFEINYYIIIKLTFYAQHFNNNDSIFHYKYLKDIIAIIVT
jgi:hypothetical protein